MKKTNNPIDTLFSGRGKIRLMTHVVAGDPDLETSLELVRRMSAAGTDLVEIQIPFSDPLADGPAIMAANQRALDQGVRPGDCFRLVADLKKNVSTPLLLMTYGNIPCQMGWKRFAEACADAGASGVIIPDLPHDERLPGLHDAFQARGIRFIHLLSPGMTDDRLQRIIGLASGFLYVTLRVGTTGAVSRIEDRGLEFLEKVRSLTALPIAAGFGISSPGHLDLLRGKVDCAIIGSHLINLRLEKGIPAVETFLQECRQRLDS